MFNKTHVLITPDNIQPSKRECQRDLPNAVITVQITYLYFVEKIPLCQLLAPYAQLVLRYWL